MTEMKSNRVSQWLEQLLEVGQDQAKAKAFFNSVRDDPNATAEDHEDFRRALAQQSYMWYVEALRGRPLTPEEVARAVNKVTFGAEK